MFTDWRSPYFEMSNLPNLMCKFNGIPIRILDFFNDIYKVILKCIQKIKEPRRVKAILKQKDKTGCQNLF